MLECLSILGLRGFGVRQDLSFATPNGKPGSGVTTLVGPNGGGKSTILEALRAAARSDNPSFSTSMRNVAAGDSVTVHWHADGTVGRLTSIRSGSSETYRIPAYSRIPKLLHLPSRRSFNPFFGSSTTTREQYSVGYQLPTFRSQAIDQFSSRLMTLERDGGNARGEFDALVEQIVGAPLSWSIDRQDSGQYFLKIQTSGGAHTSDGLGEGTVSLLFIADALHDSSEGDIIAIDEPELSLHPQYQRRLRAVLSNYSSDRQIIVATHSPYFVDWSDIRNGATIARTSTVQGNTQIATPSRASVDKMVAFASDLNNPHVLGTNAAEIFFVGDGVIIVEGQEDVVFFNLIAHELNIELSGTFFGWGVGGAEKMPAVAQLLDELGYRRVAGILDGNRSDLASSLSEAYPAFRFTAIPADDVRTKAARTAKSAVDGLTDASGHVKAEYRSAINSILSALNDYFKRDGHTPEVVPAD